MYDAPLVTNDGHVYLGQKRSMIYAVDKATGRFVGQKSVLYVCVRTFICTHQRAHSLMFNFTHMCMFAYMYTCMQVNC